MMYLRNEKNRGYTPLFDEILDPANQKHGLVTVLLLLKKIYFTAKLKMIYAIYILGDYKEGYYLGIELSEDHSDAQKPFYGPNRWPSEGNLQKVLIL